MGIDESPENIANKISRGKFTAVFFLQCMEAIGCRTLHVMPTFFNAGTKSLITLSFIWSIHC